MDILLKAVACAVVCVIFCSMLNSQWKEISLLLSICACCVLGIVAISYLKPVFTFLDYLENLGQLNEEFVKILIKVVGVGMIGELAGLICKDVGNGALGKMLELLSCAVILWLALPIFRELLSLIERVLGGI